MCTGIAPSVVMMLKVAVYKTCKNPSFVPLSLKVLEQGCPHPVLEGRCPAGFRCFPASAHLIQINASLAGLCRT